jgi:murein DD-endopeptidase MepM/ murein hydrolase activator NlpD
MLSSLRKCHRSSGVQGAKVGVILSAAAVLAGCSADVARFDLGGDTGSVSSNSSYGSSGYAGSGRQAWNEFGSAGYDRPSYRGSSVERSDLPTPQAPLTTSAIRPQDNPSSYGNGYGQGQSGYGQGQSSGYGQNGYSGGSGYAGSSNAGASNSGASNYGASNYGSSNPGASAYNAPNSYRPSNAPSGTVAPLASRDVGTSGGGTSGAATAASGETIEVRPGDTLYSLSRRHNVSVNEMMAANGLSSPNLKPGQQLHLPSGTRASHATETARPPRENYETVSQAPEPAVEAPSDWTGSSTVRPGDSLYAVARQNNVKLAELQRYNGISDVRKVKPGTVLKVPGHGGSVAEKTVAEAPYTPPAYEPPAKETPSPAVAETPAPTPGAVKLGEVTNSQATSQPSTPQQPTMLNGGPPPAAPEQNERVAKAETPGAATDAVSPSGSQNAGSVAGSRLRWPVAGKVISGFGPRPDGTHNDGVNLAAPMGTDIHAAEGGVVAYAGDELKGYGNLVLIRHDNGWVTAYAHADEILVKRGDRIKRGQVIAKAGRTGQVDQPQVHFELRQGQKPVDPTPFMERL